MIVKAMRGEGFFIMWSDVIRFERLQAESDIPYPVEEYEFEDKEYELEPERKFRRYRMIMRGVEADDSKSVLIKTKLPIYLMNDEGKTIERH